MTQSKTILISTLATSLLVLAGCTTQTVTNTNGVTDTNATVNTNTANDNTNIVVTNSNENTNAVVNENTNTEQGSEVDTSDWLIYKNSIHGFSVSYPDDWSIMSEYDSDSEKIILDDKSVGFWITASSQLFKHQDFTPGVSIVIKTDSEINELIKDYDKNNDGSFSIKIGDYNAIVYNKAEIIYQQITIVQQKNLVITTRTDENYEMSGVFKGIYQSIQLD